MKKSLLIKLHLYAGLFTSFYLLAFGASTLIMNHKMDVERKEMTKTWDAELAVDSKLSDLEMAEQIRDELGIMGWLPRWEFRREALIFTFTVTHPGRKYRIEHNAETNRLLIEEYPKGFVAVFHGLHFLNGKIPNAPLLIRSWLVYQWLSLSIMTVALVLGIWLWLKYNYKSWQGIAFAGLFIGSVLLMILI